MAFAVGQTVVGVFVKGSLGVRGVKILLYVAYCIKRQMEHVTCNTAKTLSDPIEPCKLMCVISYQLVGDCQTTKNVASQQVSGQLSALFVFELAFSQNHESIERVESLEKSAVAKLIC